MADETTRLDGAHAGANVSSLADSSARSKVTSPSWLPALGERGQIVGTEGGLELGLDPRRDGDWAWCVPAASSEANFLHYGSGNVFGGRSRFATHSMLFGNAPSASMNSFTAFHADS